MVAVASAATLWGTVGTVQELGAPDVAPVVVAGVRSLLGGALLLGVVVVTGRWSEAGTLVRRSPAVAVVTMVAMAGFQLGHLTSVRLAGVAVGTLVSIGSAPLWAGVLATLLGHRPGRRWVVATAFTIAGAAVLVAPQGGMHGEVPVGVLAGLVAGASYGTYATASKRLLEAGAGGVPVVAVALGGAGVLLAPALILGDLAWLAAPRGALAAAWLAVATVAVGYILFGRGLAGLDAPTATTLTLAEPLTATLLAVVLVDERLVGTSLLGALLLFAGLVAVGGRPPRHQDIGPAGPAGRGSRRLHGGQ